MKKSTPLKSESSATLNHQDLVLYEKPLPKAAKKQTIENILSFSQAYSVRKSKEMGQIEFILN